MLTVSSQFEPSCIYLPAIQSNGRLWLCLMRQIARNCERLWYTATSMETQGIQHLEGIPSQMREKDAGPYVFGLLFILILSGKERVANCGIIVTWIFWN